MSIRLHLIVLMADQLRWDALGPHTPNINRLLDESVRFERGYCASPLCVPARGSFFTGRTPNETGSIINPWDPVDAAHGNVRAEIPNLYDLIERDWESVHVGKQHLYYARRLEQRPGTGTRWVTMADYAGHLQRQGHRPPGGPAFRGMAPEMVGGRTTRMKRYSIPTTGVYEHGFDSFFDGFIANHAVEAIRGYGGAAPFALNAMFVAPHPPYDIPEPWHSQVDRVELPANVGTWYPDQSPLQLYNLTGVIGSRYTRAQWAPIWRVYLGLVALLDHAVGLIVDQLKAREMYEDALILFLADHGEMLGSHCLFQKMCMYEESVRTPIALKLPGSSPPAGVRDELVSAVDVLPTLCELCRLPLPEGVSGRSLVPLLTRDGAAGGDWQERAIFIQFDGNGARGNFQRAVVSGRHKLIVDLFKDEIFLELYDTVADPEETMNLAVDPVHDRRVTELLGALGGHMRSTGDLLPVPDPAATLAAFRRDTALRSGRS